MLNYNTVPHHLTKDLSSNFELFALNDRAPILKSYIICY